ncbi:MAG: type II toxin-antitoxin system VapC family toxin [Bacteroidota bacterium]
MMKKILIDTNVLIWWFRNDRRLTKSLISIIQQSNVTVSIISYWEILIKIQTGKMEMPLKFMEAMEDSSFDLLNLEPSHLNYLTNLDLYHRDPFDRIIIAQAISENLSIITSDGTFEKYPVNIIKA